MIELANKTWWQGRTDDEDAEFGKRWHQMVDFNPITNQQQSKIALLGFCSDIGVERNQGRIGAAQAPNMIRKALANHAFGNNQLGITDCGNIVPTNKDLESATTIQTQTVSHLLKSNYLPIVLGGGHETALGNALAMYNSYPSVGIINIDAHFDLRQPNPNGTSGTPFFQAHLHCAKSQTPFQYLCVGLQEHANTAALFNRADKLGVKYALASAVHNRFEQVANTIQQFTACCKTIYLSIDLDVLDAAFAPGVSATCSNGLFPNQVIKLIECIQQTNKLKLLDVVELNPNFDIDSCTAKLAANLIYNVVKNASVSTPSA